MTNSFQALSDRYFNSRSFFAGNDCDDDDDAGCGMAVDAVLSELFRFFEVETVTARCARVDETGAVPVDFFLFEISPPSLDFFRLFFDTKVVANARACDVVADAISLDFFRVLFDTEVVANACTCDVVANAVSFTFFSIKISLPSLELFRFLVAANAEVLCVARNPNAIKTKIEIQPSYMHACIHTI